MFKQSHEEPIESARKSKDIKDANQSKRKMINKVLTRSSTA